MAPKTQVSSVNLTGLVLLTQVTLGPCVTWAHELTLIPTLATKRFIRINVLPKDQPNLCPQSPTSTTKKFICPQQALNKLWFQRKKFIFYVTFLFFSFVNKIKIQIWLPSPNFTRLVLLTLVTLGFIAFVILFLLNCDQPITLSNHKN